VIVELNTTRTVNLNASHSLLLYDVTACKTNLAFYSTRGLRPYLS